MKAKTIVRRHATAELTLRELRVLRFIAAVIDEYGYQPSFREIAQEFGWSSVNAVASVMRNMQKKGVVRMQAGLSRAIEFNWKEYVT